MDNSPYLDITPRSLEQARADRFNRLKSAMIPGWQPTEDDMPEEKTPAERQAERVKRWKAVLNVHEREIEQNAIDELSAPGAIGSVESAIAGAQETIAEAKTAAVTKAIDELLPEVGDASAALNTSSDPHDFDLSADEFREIADNCAAIAQALRELD